MTFYLWKSMEMGLSVSGIQKAEGSCQNYTPRWISWCKTGGKAEKSYDFCASFPFLLSLLLRSSEVPCSPEVMGWMGYIGFCWSFQTGGGLHHAGVGISPLLPSSSGSQRALQLEKGFLHKVTTATLDHITLREFVATHTDT